MIRSRHSKILMKTFLTLSRVLLLGMKRIPLVTSSWLMKTLSRVMKQSLSPAVRSSALKAVAEALVILTGLELLMLYTAVVLRE